MVIEPVINPSTLRLRSGSNNQSALATAILAVATCFPRPLQRFYLKKFVEQMLLLETYSSNFYKKSDLEQNL
jgi:hypothetical protein